MLIVSSQPRPNRLIMVGPFERAIARACKTREEQARNSSQSVVIHQTNNSTEKQIPSTASQNTSAGGVTEYSASTVVRVTFQNIQSHNVSTLSQRYKAKQ